MAAGGKHFRGIAFLVALVLLFGGIPADHRASLVPRPEQATEHRAQEHGEEEDEEAFDKPDEALRDEIFQRAPDHKTPPSYRKYERARQHAARMPVHSTATESRSQMTDGNAAAALGPGVLTPWQSIGPGNIGGRTRALVIDPHNANVMYAGGVAGGVWKTTNGGASWTPLTDFMSNLAVTVLAMDPRDSDVIYAGTGESYASDGVQGAGIFKTTDAGAHWTNVGGTEASTSFRYVRDIVVSTHDSDFVYAATAAGVFRSPTAGATWGQSLSPSSPQGCTDLAIRTDLPADWLLASCGVTSTTRVYRNRDAGGTGSWTSVLSETNMGRTSLAIAPSAQGVVYAVAASLLDRDGDNKLDGDLHAVFRSTDGGGTWSARVRGSGAPHSIDTMLLTNGSRERCINSPETISQGFYDNVIAVDPVDRDRVWVGGIDLYRSDDGGANWGQASHWDDTPGVYPQYAHADQHVIVFHPDYDGTSNRTLYVGNDGGLFFSPDSTDGVVRTSDIVCLPNSGQVSWGTLVNQFGVTQFYDGAVYPDGASYIGGTQDNGTIRGTSATGPNGWTTIWGGDGGYVAVDPNDTDTVYAENPNMALLKLTDHHDGSFAAADAVTGITDTGRFITPFVMDPSNSQRLWTGGCKLWRTIDGADSWSQASAPLPFSNDACDPTDAQIDNKVSAIAIAPGTGNHVIAGTELGYVVHSAVARTTTAATTWANELPRIGAFVSSVAFEPGSTTIMYATYTTFGGPHVYRFDGAAWSSIDGSGSTALPDIPVHSIFIDPEATERLYVGTDLGVFVSLDGGTTWARENTGFANTVTEALRLSPAPGVRTLFAFTHGRGAYKVFLPHISAKISVNDVTVSPEGNSGTTTADFTVSLDRVPDSDVYVDYATADGTAVAGSDYDALSGGTLHFLANGPTTQHVLVTVRGDVLDEDNERFTLNLSDPFNAAIADGAGSALIIDDDVPPSVQIGDGAATEGNLMNLGVGLSAPSGKVVQVRYSTSDGTAHAGSDYVAKTSATVTFQPNDTFENAQVQTTDDVIDESQYEDFTVTLSNPVNATVGARSTATGVVVDNDATIAGIADASVAEGNVGETHQMQFTVNLSNPSDSNVDMDYTLSGGTATANTDYDPSPGHVHFDPGQTQRTVYVDVFGDDDEESDETFSVFLTNPVNTAIVDPAGLGRIIDDDHPTASITARVRRLEGDSGTKSFTFTVSLDHASLRTVTISFDTIARSAHENRDYLPNHDVVQFDPGETTQTLTVLVKGDRRRERNEAFIVRLRDPVNAVVPITDGKGVIVNDD